MTSGVPITASNGRATADQLSAMPGRNGDGSTQMSSRNAAASYARMRAAMQAAGLGDLLPSNGWSCYRSLAAQQHMRDIGMTTIPVGQSVHGETAAGAAVDYANLGGFGAARHNWMRANGAAFGWFQPSWAAAGGSLPEPWHWEYWDARDTHAGEGTFLMALTDAQQTQLFNEIMNLRGFIWAGGPDVAAGNGDAGSIFQRVINLDRQVTGAQGFTPSVASRVITIEDTVTEPTPPTQSHGHHGSALWPSILALVIAFAIGAGLVVAVLSNDPDDGTISGLTALVGGLLGWLASVIRERRGGDHDHGHDVVEVE